MTSKAERERIMTILEKMRNTTMPDNTERKRLKKKMLDRWENEGGRIAGDSSIANQSNPASQREGEGNQASASNNSSRVNNITSRKKRRALLENDQ